MPADMDFRCNGPISGQFAEIAAIRSPCNNCIENGTSILNAFAEEFAAMDVTRQGLVEHFQLLSDDELLADFRQGDLTELAKGVAVEELARRKIDPLQIPSESPADEQATSISGDLILVARYFTAAEAHILRSREATSRSIRHLPLSLG